MSDCILLRGLFRESGHWHRFPAALAAHGMRAHTLDLPGAGLRRSESSPASMSQIVADLRNQKKSLGLSSKPLLVGISLGGMAAAEWALAAPEEISGLVLINSSLGGLSPFYRRLRPAALMHILCILMSSGKKREAAVLRLTSAFPEARGTEVLDEWARLRNERPMTLGHALKQLLAASGWSAKHAPKVPTLILRGLADRMVHPSCSEAIASAWKCELRSHPEAGHDLTLDFPDWAAEAIAGWAGGR